MAKLLKKNSQKDAVRILKEEMLNLIKELQIIQTFSLKNCTKVRATFDILLLLFFI
jgi:hypothetical protein